MQGVGVAGQSFPMLMNQNQNPKFCTQNPKPCYFSGLKGRNNALSSARENVDDLTLTSASFSFNNADTISSTTDLNSKSEADLPRVMRSRPCPKVIDDSIAVVKDSNEPYEDFRHSMLQMIAGKQIHSKDDLQRLLQCFLELNSPCHHDVVVTAFMGICSQQVMIPKEIVTVQDQEPCFVHHGDKKPGS